MRAVALLRRRRRSLLRARRGAAAAPWQDARQGHRRALRRPDRARPLRPARRPPRTPRRARARLRGRAARDDPRGRPGRRQRARPPRCATPREAARDGDQVALAAARGSVRAGLFRGAYTVTVEAAGRGDAATAQALAAAARVPHGHPLHAPGRAARRSRSTSSRRGTLAPQAARQAVRKDLLDAYQARLRELLADARRGIEQDLPGAPRRGRRAGRGLLRDPRPALRRGPRRGRRATGVGAAFAALPEAGDDLAARAGPRRHALEGFTAAPFTPEEAARRAQQLLQFLALVPVEYGRGVKDDQVTRDFEIQEAVAFRTGAVARVRRPARPARQARPRPHRDAPRARSTSSAGWSRSRAKQKEGVPTHEQVETRRGAGRERAQGRDAAEVDREDRRVRLRPDRAHARPHGGRRRRRPVPPGRAGAARGLRVLRVRPRAAAALASTRASRSTSRA